MMRARCDGGPGSGGRGDGGPADGGALDRWADAVAVMPPGPGGLAATLGALASAAALERTADRAIAILAALDAPLRGRYPDAGVRINDLAEAGGRGVVPAVAA